MKNFITFNLLKQKQRHDQVGEEISKEKNLDCFDSILSI